MERLSNLYNVKKLVCDLDDVKFSSVMPESILLIKIQWASQFIPW